MTDTTDIKALRDEFTTDQWWYKELLEATKQIPGNLDLRRAVIGVIPNLIKQLEADRQRADDCDKSAKYSAATNKSVVAANCRLREEIAALKGEQVPVVNPVLPYADSYRDMARRGADSVPIWGVITDLERNIAPLFTAPQKSVVLPGISELIDACDSTPAVRDVHVWDLAISEVKRLNPSLFSDKSAAGGIVKDGE